MKKLIYIGASALILIVFFVAGFVVGDKYSGYDVLCENEFSAHKLTKDFKSQSGIILPAGTTVYARGCKPNTQVNLKFFINNWDYPNIKKLNEDPYPAYYLEVENEEKI